MVPTSRNPDGMQPENELPDRCGAVRLRSSSSCGIPPLSLLSRSHRSVRLSMSPNSTGMLPVRSLFLVSRRDRVRHRVVVHVEGRHSAHRVSHRSEGADLERVRVRPEPRRQRAARCRGSRLRGGPQARPRVVSCPDVLFPVGEPLTFPVSLSTNGWHVTDVELSARVIEGDTDVSVGQHAFAVVGDRCQLAPPKTVAIASRSPWWASETNFTPPRPLADSERRKASQNAPSSLVPTSMPMISRLPSLLTAVATTTLTLTILPASLRP